MAGLGLSSARFDCEIAEGGLSEDYTGVKRRQNDSLVKVP